MVNWSMGKVWLNLNPNVNPNPNFNFNLKFNLNSSLSGEVGRGLLTLT